MIKESISKIVDRKNLSRQEMIDCMDEIMKGEATSSQIASFLTALRMKAETFEEIAGGISSMRNFMTTINPKVSGKLMDVVGTGGDSIKTFNVSTASAIVASACGCVIAKHGNRAFTGKCGAADFLEALGIKIDLPCDKVKEMIEKENFGFMFAPLYHPAMKFAGPVRKEIGIRTIFNVLGPLTNPANAQIRLVGVYSEELAEKVSLALKDLNVERAMVVFGLDGLDEISTIGKTVCFELSGGKISKKVFSPEDFGLKKARVEDVSGGNPQENAELVLKIFEVKEKGPKLDIILLNAGTAIYLYGKAKSVNGGIEIAKNAISSGKVLEKLDRLREFSLNG